MLTLPIRTLRWLTRNHETPRIICILCHDRSQNHPAGPLHRYTTVRIAGLPVCERHSIKELAGLL